MTRINIQGLSRQFFHLSRILSRNSLIPFITPSITHSITISITMYLTNLITGLITYFPANSKISSIIRPPSIPPVTKNQSPPSVVMCYCCAFSCASFSSISFTSSCQVAPIPPLGVFHRFS